MKSVILNEVYFRDGLVTIEIIDDRGQKYWKRIYTDKVNGLHQDFQSNRKKLANILEELVPSYNDPSIQSLLSDASYVTEHGHSIYSWVRDDYIFSVQERVE